MLDFCVVVVTGGRGGRVCGGRSEPTEGIQSIGVGRVTFPEEYVVVGTGGGGVTTGVGELQSPPGRGGLRGTARSSLANVLKSGMGSRQHLFKKSSKSIVQAIAPPNLLSRMYLAFAAIEV